MKNYKKKFEEYLEHQSDLEMGINYFEMAKNCFIIFLSLNQVEQEQKINITLDEIEKLLATSEFFLNKTRNPKFLAITQNFKNFILSCRE